MKNRHIIETADSSNTIFVPDLKQHYHSTHGALQESEHVFIEAGFRYANAPGKTLNILEVGFGTGLNALLTLREAELHKTPVNYLSLEKYPLSLEEISKLDYDSIIKEIDIQNPLLALHSCEWNKGISVSDFFTLKKIDCDLKKIDLPKEYFDLIYYDAFAPSAQANLWTIEIFTKMHDTLNVGGSLVTYCVKGDVRRNMKAAGFSVEKIPGPPGKREMARAHKLA